MIRMWQMRLSTFLLLATAVPSPAPAKPAFTTKKDQYGTVYHVDFEQVQAPGDLTAIPGIKLAWYQHGAQLNGWLANARDIDGDGRIELFLAAARDGERRLVCYHQDGTRAWQSPPIGDPLGGESGLAIVDLDADGSFELVFNLSRELWCLDARTGKTRWKVPLPRSHDNYQVSVVGHFLDRKQQAVVCRVGAEVSCYDAKGEKKWDYRIQHRNLYGHEMTHYDADRDGLDEVYISLNGKFIVLNGDGTLRWSDDTVRNHTDFILCGDVDGDGELEIVYDRNGCDALKGPIACVDGGTGKPEKLWNYRRPGMDHLQRATLGDFDPSRPGLELVAVGKRQIRGGLVLWSAEEDHLWHKDIPAGWVTWGDWNGDRNPEILLSGGIGGQNGFEVWTGSGKRLYALAGTGATPMGVESAGPLRPDLDGNGKADLLLWTRRGYMLLLEAP